MKEFSVVLFWFALIALLVFGGFLLQVEPVLYSEHLGYIVLHVLELGAIVCLFYASFVARRIGSP